MNIYDIMGEKDMGLMVKIAQNAEPNEDMYKVWKLIAAMHMMRLGDYVAIAHGDFDQIEDVDWENAIGSCAMFLVMTMETFGFSENLNALREFSEQLNLPDDMMPPKGDV